jgi:hypothetical protein
VSSYWISVLITVGIGVVSALLFRVYIHRRVRRTYARLYPPQPAAAGPAPLPAKEPDRPADEPVTSA